MAAASKEKKPRAELAVDVAVDEPEKAADGAAVKGEQRRPRGGAVWWFLGDRDLLAACLVLLAAGALLVWLAPAVIQRPR